MNNNKTVLWSIALDEYGNEVNIDNAVKGNTYYCLACNNRMIPNKGQVKAHHFSHWRIPDNYSYESELHLYTKKVIYNYLVECKKNCAKSTVSYMCSNCRKTMEVDLTSSIDDIGLERVYDIENKIVRPDISLESQGFPKYVIEVVVTHDMENDAIEAYEKAGVTVIVIYVASTDAIIPHILLHNSRVLIDYCDECSDVEVEKKRIYKEESLIKQKIQQEKEAAFRKYLSNKQIILNYLSIAKQKGFPILPFELWRLFEQVQPQLRRANDYVAIFDVNTYKDVHYIEINSRKFFIDHYEIFDKEDSFISNGKDINVVTIYRTYNKTKPYCMAIAHYNWSIKALSIKSFASQEQASHYEYNLQTDNYMQYMDWFKEPDAKECLSAMYNQYFKWK